MTFNYLTPYTNIPYTNSVHKLLKVRCELTDSCFDGGANAYNTVTEYRAKRITAVRYSLDKCVYKLVQVFRLWIKIITAL